MSIDAWPDVDLDPIERLRVMNAVVAGTVMEERTLAAPFDRVWRFVTDFEYAVPRFDRDVRRVKILSRQPDAAGGDRERIRLRAWPSPVPFDVVVEPGWCWMASSIYVVGMAAVPLGDDSTRFAHLEGIPATRPGMGVVGWLSTRRHRRHVRRDIDGIARCLGL